MDSGISVAGKSRKITENHGNGNESSYCSLLLLPGNHGNRNESSHFSLVLLLVAKCWSVYFFVCFQL